MESSKPTRPRRSDNGGDEVQSRASQETAVGASFDDDDEGSLFPLRVKNKDWGWEEQVVMHCTCLTRMIIYAAV